MVEKAKKEVDTAIREAGEAAVLEVGVNACITSWFATLAA